MRKSEANRTARAAAGEAAGTRGARGRLRRTDQEKIQLVRQVLASENQSFELRKLGIYPNQFYDWKRRFASELGLQSGSSSGAKKGIVQSTGSLVDEAKAFIRGKEALLERLRSQRAELDKMIAELES